VLSKRQRGAFHASASARITAALPQHRARRGSPFSPACCGSHENRIGTRCGLINFALDIRQKRTRSLFGLLFETSSKRTSRASLSRSELQANQLARAFLACRSGRDRGGKPSLFVLNKEKKRDSHCARVRARWQA